MQNAGLTQRRLVFRSTYTVCRSSNLFPVADPLPDSQSIDSLKKVDTLLYLLRQGVVRAKAWNEPEVSRNNEIAAATPFTSVNTCNWIPEQIGWKFREIGLQVNFEFPENGFYPP